MALSDLTPKASACFKGECNQLSILDTTGLYNNSTNVGGWNDASTEDNTNITLATLQYKHSSETDYTEIDVTTVVNTMTVEGEFFLLEDEEVSLSDGLYHFIYTLSNGVDTVEYDFYVYNLCSSRCCVDKLWTKVAQDLAEDCSCNSTLYDKTVKAESYIKAILSLGNVTNVDTVNSLLEKLQEICNNENCNCN